MLTKYDAAKAALDAARSFEDVLAIKDKAEAYKAVARVAKDEETVRWATEIKTRAERMAGEMLLSLNLKPGRPNNGNRESPLPKLAELKVEKADSSRWQKLAKVPKEKFESEIAAGHVKRAEIVRSVAEPKDIPEPASKAPKKPKAEITDSMAGSLEELSRLRAEKESLKAENERLLRDAESRDRELRFYAAAYEADERTAPLLKRIKELQELNRILEERNNGLVAEKNAAIAQANRLRKQVERLEKLEVKK
jgi:hypothetical protein